MLDPAIRDQVRRARTRFLAMAGAYGLGVFNDSLFRQSAMLLAVFVGASAMQNWIMALFMLPFILFSWAAGWLADRFAKRRVVIASKLLEVVAMIFGAVGIITLNWPCVLAMVFIMAWQACIFSPALNGAIPELYPDSYVLEANARLKVVTTAAILGGVALAGVILDLPGSTSSGIPLGRLVVAVSVLAISVLGFLVSLGVPSRPAADPRLPFPWIGPLETFRNLRLIWQDRLLRLVVVADVLIWFVGALLTQVINLLALRQLNRSQTFASAMLAVWVIGVALGGLLSSRLAVGPRWHRVLPLGLVFMGVSFCLVAFVPFLPAALTVPVLFSLLGLAALFGGIVLVPCESFIQTRPAPDRKGAVIAAANFLAFAGMFLSCGLAFLLGLLFQNPSTHFAVAGLLAIPVALWIRRALARENSS